MSLFLEEYFCVMNNIFAIFTICTFIFSTVHLFSQEILFKFFKFLKTSLIIDISIIVKYSQNLLSNLRIFTDLCFLLHHVHGRPKYRHGERACAHPQFFSLRKPTASISKFRILYSYISP